GKDNIKLQELGDLLLELECAKNGGGLGILDEPTYLRPIVEKLPDDLQRRWQRHAYRYKVNNTVDYPPFAFAVLSEFVQDIAQERNDPFLTLETADEETVRPTRAVNRQNSRTTRQGVTTIKTDMTDSSSAVEHPSSAPEEPKRWCFIHRRPHPLTKCRVFRAKPLEERRNLLKRERVCFRCAATRGHIARDCEESIHCDECQSEDHITALHSEPYATQQKNGEEPKASDKQNQELINVTTTCTEVCKNRKDVSNQPEMKKHYFTFMQSLLDHGHAEVVPLDEVATTKPGWYLPHFGVYNPQKPNKVRIVYEAAAECGEVSLNSLLLPGPDLTNSLIGILLRFRESPVAFMADVEQMFYSFSVQENHRNYLKFLWYQDNNPGKDILEYRMKVHIFGSTSSPAVATYGLRKTAEG
ncbi:hypothetical protein QZH41_010583, partial [Actinostola sp. cb2023]